MGEQSQTHRFRCYEALAQYRSHSLIAVLAFVLHRAIEKKLKAAKLDFSATKALIVLKSVRVVDIDLGNGTRKRCVTRGSQRVAQILRALGVTELDPQTQQQTAKPSCRDKPRYPP
jgi:hypothetical protein